MEYKSQLKDFSFSIITFLLAALKRSNVTIYLCYCQALYVGMLENRRTDVNFTGRVSLPGTNRS